MIILSFIRASGIVCVSCNQQSTIEVIVYSISSIQHFPVESIVDASTLENNLSLVNVMIILSFNFSFIHASDMVCISCARQSATNVLISSNLPFQQFRIEQIDDASTLQIFLSFVNVMIILSFICASGMVCVSYTRQSTTEVLISLNLSIQHFPIESIVNVPQCISVKYFYHSLMW